MFVHEISYTSIPTSTSQGSHSLDLAISRAFADAMSYLASRPGDPVILGITEKCDRCQGSGKVPGKRKSGRQCPVCHGRPVRRVIGPVALEPPTGVEVDFSEDL